MNPARYAAGWLEVRFTGAEPERALEAMAERGIDFWDAEPPRDFSLTVRTGVRTGKQIEFYIET